jgi:hypothetical protein
MCGNADITLGLVIVGRRIELMFPRSVNEIVGIEVVGVFVGCIGGDGVFAGVVGILVGVVGILVGVVGIGVMTGGGFIGGDIMPIDRRARPSSGSSEIDAFLLVRRHVAPRCLCSWCGFIVFSPRVSVINPLPT